MLFFLTWYLVEKCFAAYEARKLKAKRRVEFQKAWRASTSYGDELDNIISK